MNAGDVCTSCRIGCMTLFKISPKQSISKCDNYDCYAFLDLPPDSQLIKTDISFGRSTKARYSGSSNSSIYSSSHNIYPSRRSNKQSRKMFEKAARKVGLRKRRKIEQYVHEREESAIYL